MPATKGNTNLSIVFSWVPKARAQSNLSINNSLPALGELDPFGGRDDAPDFPAAPRNFF
jgi:hypothetical protein